MNRSRSSYFALTALTGLALHGCADERAPTGLASGWALAATEAPAEQAGRYLVVFGAERVPAAFGERVSKLGGAVEASLDSIGVAGVTGLTKAAAAELVADEEIQAVEPDAVVTMSGGDADAAEAIGEGTPGQRFAPADATASPTAAAFYARQWNMRAVFAHDAWAAGHLGATEVVVAILDTGIDYLNPDLVGLVDLSRSVSFVPEDDAMLADRFPGRHVVSDLFWHGTAAASIIGSNAVNVAGINRRVTMIGVKVRNNAGELTLGRVLEGLLYAADNGADVINMSFGLARDRRSNPGSVAAFERATAYATRRGAVLVGASGQGNDLDRDRDGIVLPCQLPHVICASATGPTSAAGLNGPWTDVDAWASYSNYGRSAIDVSAPGGTGEPGQFRRVWLPCTRTWTESSPPACRAGQPLAQGLGPSWAAAHTSGLAALLVARHGKGNPALIRSRILESADDLGEPGTDPYFGKGRINVARALAVIE